MRLSTMLASSLLVLIPAAALAVAPEIQRTAATPAQAKGVTHLVRSIPEACAWLQGTFTGDAASPYRFAPVRSSATCQPRAQLLNPAKAKPSIATGWKLNDVVRIPSAECPGLQAVVEIWRKPVVMSTPKLDQQGRARIYLQDAKAGAGNGVPMTAYTAKASVEGKPCD